MIKRKKTPWKGILIGLWALGLAVAVFYRFQAHNPIPHSENLQPVQRDLPITTETVSFDNNKYGKYLTGIIAQQNQDYDQTDLLFHQALTLDKDNEKLKQTVYLLKAVRGAMPEAISLAKELNGRAAPELLTDYLLIAEALKNKDYPKAEKLLYGKPLYGPDNVLKPVLSAWIFAGQGKRQEAEKELADLESKNMDSLLAYYRALLALYFKDTDTAKEQFQKMGSLSQDGYPSLTALVILHDFYQKQNLWQDGHPDYERFKALLNKTPSVRHLLEDLKAPSEITPEIGTAIAFYDISVALSPLKIEETCLIFNELALYLYPDALTPKIWGGELMEQSGNYRAANRIYDRIPNQTTLIRLKKALNLIADKQHNLAVPLLEQLTQETPNDAYAYLLLGDSYAEEEKTAQAVQAYQKSGALLKKNNAKEEASHIFLTLGSIYDTAKQAKQAESALLESIRLNPNNPQALNYLGYLWLDNNKNIEEAFQMVKKASELAPEDPNIMDSLAWGYYLKKDYQKALELAEKSTDMISYSSIAYSHLGDIYHALGRNREAKYQYRKALDLTADITPELKAELEQKLSR